MNIIEGMRYQASKGKYIGGPILGYDYKKDHLTPSSFEVNLVHFIFYAFLSGVRKIEISRFLDKCGFTGKKGGKFILNAVTTILENRTYIGEVKFQGIWYKGNHEPIISETVFNSVQNLLELNTTIGNEAWLSGVIHCPDCGSPMIKSHTNNNETQIYYVCSESRMNQKCKANGIRKEVAEHFVLNELSQRMPNFEYIDISFLNDLFLGQQKRLINNCPILDKVLKELTLIERGKISSPALNWLTKLLLPDMTVTKDVPSKRKLYFISESIVPQKNYDLAKLILEHQLPIYF